MEVVAKSLKGGDMVQLAGFGTFEVKKRAARVGVNPMTVENVQIKASKEPALRFGKPFKELF